MSTLVTTTPDSEHALARLEAWSAQSPVAPCATEVASLAQAAGEHRRELLPALWSATCSVTLSPDAWAAFAQAAGQARNLDLLQRVWRAYCVGDVAFCEEAGAAFLLAAARCGDRGLVEDVWRDWQQKVKPVGICAIRALVRAALLMEDPALLETAWERAVAHLAPDGETWKALAAAAAHLKHERLLAPMWEALIAASGFEPIAATAFIQAAAATKQSDFLERLWADWQASGHSLTAECWSAFAVAAAMLRRGDLVERLWRGGKASGALLGPEAAPALVNAAQQTGRADLLREMWELASAAQPCDAIVLRTFIHAGVMPGCGDLQEKAWERLRACGASLDPSTVRALLTTIGHVRRPEQLRRLWEQLGGTALSGELWRDLVKAAGNSDDADLHTQLWQARPRGAPPVDAVRLGQLASLAERSQRPDLFEALWRGWCSAEGPPLTAPTWGHFATAAAVLARGDMLPEIWESCRAQNGSMTSASWGAFAKAAERTGRHELLPSIWAACRESGASLMSLTWGSFAHAAGELGHGALLEEIWSACKDSGAALEPSAWGMFAKASGRTNNPELLAQLWSACGPAGLGEDRRSWGSFANAAGAVQRGDVVTAIWQAAVEQGMRLDSPAWGSFANAAAVVGRDQLLEEIWHACKRSGERLDAKGWGSLVNAIGEVARGDLLDDVWRTLWPQRRALNEIAWGTLAKAAGLCGRADLLGEFWASFRDVGLAATPGLWNAFANAAGQVGREDVLEQVLATPVGGEDPHAQLQDRIRRTPPEALENLWAGWLSPGNPIDAVVCFAFLRAAINHDLPELFNQVLAAREDLGIRMESFQWGKLAHFAASVGRASFLSRLWRSCKDAGAPLDDYGWASFFSAASEVEEGSVLAEAVNELSGHGRRLNQQALGSLARAAGTLGEAEVLAQAWALARASTERIEIKGWTTFAKAAGACQDGALLHDIWQAWSSLGSRPDQMAWTVLVKAAGDSQHEDLLRRLWSAWLADGGPNDSQGWGAFADACGDCVAGDLLRDAWARWKKSGLILDPEGWSTFARAAGDCEDGDLLTDLWRVCRKSGAQLDAIAWCSLARACSRTNQDDLLVDVWDGCSPVAGQLDDRAWAELTAAAIRMGLEDLVLEMFRRREKAFAQAGRARRGPADHQLAGIAARMQDGESAREMLETLAGYRYGPERWRDGLLFSKPSAKRDGPMEEAAAGMAAWVITAAYYGNAIEFAKRIDTTVDLFDRLPDHRQAAWAALCSGGLEATVSCVRWLVRKRLRERFGYLDHLDDGRLVAEVRAAHGGVLDHIIDFQHAGVDALGVPGPLDGAGQDLPVGASALVDALCAAQVERLRHRHVDEAAEADRRATELAGLLTGPGRKPQQRRTVFEALVHRLARTVTAVLVEELKREVHTLKRDFVRIFQVPLSWGLDEEQDLHLAREARDFLRRLDRPLLAYGTGAIRPLDLVPALYRFLIRQRRSGPHIRLPAERIPIAAWEGAHDQLLVPMLKELRANSEKALALLAPYQAELHVTLSRGTGDDAGLAVLTVGNTFPASYRSDHTSTGRGLADVRRLAMQFRAGALQGYAHDSIEQRPGALPLFTWRICLPLYEAL